MLAEYTPGLEDNLSDKARIDILFGIVRDGIRPSSISGPDSTFD